MKQAQAIIENGGKGNHGRGDDGDGGGGKGAKKGKKQVCFSFGRGRDGPCHTKAVGDNNCPNGRLHECEFCHKKDHKSKDCPDKPARIKDW